MSAELFNRFVELNIIRLTLDSGLGAMHVNNIPRKTYYNGMPILQWFVSASSIDRTY